MQYYISFRVLTNPARVFLSSSPPPPILTPFPYSPSVCIRPIILPLPVISTPPLPHLRTTPFTSSFLSPAFSSLPCHDCV